MKSTKEKLSNMASAAKEHIDIYKAKVEEKAEKSVASTDEEERIAQERRKAKEAEAKKHLHEAKAEHAAQTLLEKQSHHHHPTVGAPTANPAAGTTIPTTATTVPTYPLGGLQPHRPGPAHNQYL